MKISEIFKQQKRTYSFEFFPPEDYSTAVKFGINAGQLMKLDPSFVSVTYGAGGGTQEHTFNLVDLFQNDLGFVSMAHYTCLNATREKIAYEMRILQDMGVDNVMLLRGDPPKGEEEFPANPDGFNYGSDLIRFVNENYDFCIGAGAYPEKHLEAKSLEEDLINLRLKVEAGADFLITQMFFDNNLYWDFLEKTERTGIHCRIIPGIIPITNYKSLSKFAKNIGVNVSERIRKQMEPHMDDPDAVYKIGLELATEQCHDLLQQGAPGIHFYTLNKSRAAIDLYENLSGDFKEVRSRFEKASMPHAPRK